MVKEGYKQTEVGEVPEDWKVLKVKDVAPLQRGFDLPTSQIKKGRYPVVYSNGVMNCHAEFMIHGPGVVTGRSGTIGNVHYISENYWPHNTALWVTEFIDSYPKYIYYFYKFLKLARFSTGSGVPTLNRNDVHDSEVAIPRLEEQHAIAQALSDVDALIASLDKLITKKRHLKTAAMQQLLTGKKRLLGFGEGKGYKQTEVGVIPEDWNIYFLKDLCLAIVDGTHYTPSYVSDGIPFYSVENVTSNDFKNTKFISNEEHLILIKRCKPEKGDILLTRIGSLGVTKLIDWDIDASIYVSLALLKLSEKVYPEYLYTYSKSQRFVKDIEKRSLVNATPQKINMEDIGKVPVCIPENAEEQQQIAAVLSDMDAEIAALEARRVKTQAIKQGMMQELLTGKTRLMQPSHA